MLSLPVLHPIFVHFPVALLPVAVACDALGRITGRMSLAHAGWWTLLSAAIISPVTAATGWVWLQDMEESHHAEMLVHQWLGTLLPVVLLVLAAWRYRFFKNALPCSGPLLFALTAALLAVTVQGHLGGLMTFGDASPQQHGAKEAEHNHA